MGCTQSTSNEVKDVNDITDEIKVFQTSGTQQYSKNRSILTDDGAVWKSSSAFNTFIIFDCGKYEISRIYIEFAKQSKPENIKLRLSEVGNAYSFRSSPPLKTWQLETDLISKEIPWQDVDYKVNLLMNDHENINIYQNGFKRYLRLDFNKWVTNISICRFFGKLSNRIPENSYQFDPILDAHLNQKDDTNEEKTESKYNDDNKEPYAPKIIDQSPAAKDFENGIIDNIWDDDMYSGWVMDIKEQIAYIIIDLGNNKVNEIYLRTYLQFRCKLCRILTADNPTKKSRKWDSLNEDNDFDEAVKLEEGVIYDIRDKHKKYIKLEFEKYSGSDCRNYYGLQRLKLFGDSDFLEKNIQFTMDDIKNMDIIDEDFVQKYKEEEMRKLDLKLRNIKSPVIEEGVTDYTEYNVTHARKYYINTEMSAYVQRTFFEQEQLLKAAELQKQIAEEYGKQYAKIRLEEAKQASKDRKAWRDKEEEYETALENKVDGKIIVELKLEKQRLFDVKVKGRGGPNRLDALDKERKKKLKEIYKDITTEQVYNCWKESVEEHPLQISDKYNVFDYQNMIDWAETHKKEQLAKLFTILARLFEESMDKKQALIHKYHLFQLSRYIYTYKYEFDVTDAYEKYKKPPAYILFDAEDKQIDRIEFALWYRYCDVYKMPVKIEVYTADDIIMCENKQEDMAKDDIINWSNFNMIQQIDLPTQYIKDGHAYTYYMSIEETRCNIEFRNKRYIKVVFYDKNNGAPQVRVGICDIYVEKKTHDDEKLERKEECVLAKHRLKLVETIEGEYKIIDVNNIRWGFNDPFKSVYHNGYGDYKTTDGANKPVFIFACCDSDKPIRQIEKFDIQFNCNSLHTRRFHSFIVSTSNTLDQNDSKDNENNEEWIEIFNEQIEDGISWNNTYVDAINTIQLNCKNKRYLKFDFDCGEDGTGLNIKFLKFYAKDPDEYVWDSDRNIVKENLKIAQTSPGGVTGKSHPTYIYVEHIQNYFAPSYNYIPNYSPNKDRIRDEICRVVNKLRNTEMENISKDEKHFVKWLLCWQQPEHYDEILLTSKRVMDILSKPLIEEYKRLQQENSEILSLSLNKKDRLPSNIVSNHGLLEWDYCKWYKYRKALFYPQDLNPLAEQWVELGLNLSDKEFKHLRRNGIIDKDKSFTSADELAMEYLNLIAQRLDPSFQQTMKDLFEENRKTLNLKYPTGDGTLGVLSGPIKTKARQNIKVTLDYFDKPPPQCMAVLDIVRCAIVCQDDKELCHLFYLICNKFSGKILRIKNAFDSIDKGTYGYRAVLINIAYGDGNLLDDKYSMICEVQLLISSFYQVRKLMHLGYGIVRSEEGGVSDNRKPYVVLAQDSCKFGKLDL